MDLQFKQPPNVAKFTPGVAESAQAFPVHHALGVLKWH